MCEPTRPDVPSTASQAMASTDPHEPDRRTFRICQLPDHMHVQMVAKLLHRPLEYHGSVDEIEIRPLALFDRPESLRPGEIIP